MGEKVGVTPVYWRRRHTAPRKIIELASVVDVGVLLNCKICCSHIVS
jgi:hypothetical protein